MKQAWVSRVADTFISSLTMAVIGESATTDNASSPSWSPSSSDPVANRRRPAGSWVRVCAAAVLVTLTILTYWRAPGTEFIGDDSRRIIMNEYLLRQGFQESVANILPDRPLLVITIFINYLLGGLNPWGYKVFSLALHIAVGMAFFTLLCRVQKRDFGTTDPFVPAIITAVFLVHPLNSQALLSAIQRGVILAALGGIGSLLFFLEYLATRRRAFFLLSLLCYLLGILSKSFVICVPPIMLLYLWLSREPIRPLLGHFLPFLLISGLPVIPYHFWGVDRQEGANILNWREYLVVQTRVVWIYLKLFVVPTNLRYFYEIDPNPRLLKNLTWLAIAGHGAILAGAALLVRHRKMLAGFGIFAMYLAFLPESGLFPVYDLAFEHRTYFPMIFMLFALFAVVRSFPALARKLALCFLPVILAFSLMTNARIDAVGTTEKWVLDSFRHLSARRDNNLEFLNSLLAAKSGATATVICRTMIDGDPSFPPYSLFLRVFTFPNDAPHTRKETVDLIGSALVKRNISQVQDRHTIRNFLSFMINNSSKFATDQLTYEKNLEPILKNQLRFFVSDPGYFLHHVRFHQSILIRLKGHFEGAMETGELPERDFIQYLSVLGQLSVYYPENRAELANRADHLKSTYPGRAALVDSSEKYYRRLQQRLDRLRKS